MIEELEEQLLIYKNKLDKVQSRISVDKLNEDKLLMKVNDIKYLIKTLKDKK